MGGGVGGLLYTIRNPLYPGQGLAWWPNGFPDHPQVPQTITQRYNLSNGRGDIVAQSDSSGALTWTASYEAYGKRTKETGANQDKQRANSKDEDPTGLLNEGFRYRDIETGVWLSRDPAGFVDGPNLYAYVKQNPWTYFDPKGLNRVVVSGGAYEDRKNDRDPDANWKNFVKAAEHNIVASQRKLKEGEEIEWMVQKSSYENRAKNDGKSVDAYTKEIEAIANKHGVNLRYYDSPKDLVSMINSDKGGNPRSGSSLITDFSFYGHGTCGRIFTRAGLRSDDSLNALKFRSGELKIDRNAFASGATATSWACNSGTKPPKGVSFISGWQEATGVSMNGLVGKSDYGPTAEPGTLETTGAYLHWFASGSLCGPCVRQSSGPIPGKQYAPDNPNPGHSSYWVKSQNP